MPAKKAKNPDLARLAQDIQTLRDTWRGNSRAQNSELRLEILRAFQSTGFAPHELMPFYVMVEGGDILIRYLDLVRDDLIIRRTMNAIARAAVEGEETSAQPD